MSNNKSHERPVRSGSVKKQFSLPTTTAKPPMPPVKPPKKKEK